MVPIWTRAWRFASVYAYASIDLLFAILWFAAGLSVATWEAAGIRKGSEGTSKKGRYGSCSDFAYGSEAKCATSKVSIGFGVVIFLTFVATSGISIHGLLRYRKTGVMPYTKSARHSAVEQLDPNKDVWSSNMDELDPESDEPDQRRAYRQLPAEEAQQGLLQRPTSQEDQFQDHHSTHNLTETEDGLHPGRPLSYQSSTNLSIAPPSYREQSSAVGQSALSPTGYVAPSALSPTDYEAHSGRMNIPQGIYSADPGYR